MLNISKSGFYWKINSSRNPRIVETYHQDSMVGQALAGLLGEFSEVVVLGSFGDGYDQASDEPWPYELAIKRSEHA